MLFSSRCLCNVLIDCDMISLGVGVGSLEALMCSGVMALSPAVSPRVVAKRLARSDWAFMVHHFVHTKNLRNEFQQSLKV